MTKKTSYPDIDDHPSKLIEITSFIGVAMIVDFFDTHNPPNYIKEECLLLMKSLSDQMLREGFVPENALKILNDFIIRYLSKLNLDN
jgi:hypothetical protein